MAESTRSSSIMLDHDRVDSAIDYLDLCADLLARDAVDQAQKSQLADIYLMAAQLKQSAPERRDEAIRNLQAARKLNPDDLRIRQELGEQLISAGKTELALEEFIEASRINPDDQDGLRRLALLHFKIGNYPEAHAIFSRLADANPADGG